METSQIINKFLQIIQFQPKWVKRPLSWVGHLHFANFLINEIKPHIFVELGTHSGNSYFSFCQAVKDLGIATKCFAVDTWEGDEHSGKYGNEIYNEVVVNNDLYSNFSTLLRMTFDSALIKFENKSIDILHIDGMHSYDAVKHDFESWLPKLTDNAIVLFHDTQVKSNNFGVWKLWEELKEIYPINIEFKNSNGLGVLQLNNLSNNKNIDWLIQNSAISIDLARYITSVGENFLKLKEVELDLQEKEIKYNEINLLKEVNDLKINLSEIKKQLRQSSSVLYEIQNKNTQISIELFNIINSISWKITVPIRELKRWVKFPKKQVFRYLEFVVDSPWFQFPEQLRNKVINFISKQTNKEKADLVVLRERLKINDMLEKSSELKKIKNLSEDQRIKLLLQIIDDIGISIPTHETPIVSVIIPVYGHLDYTLAAIVSILKNIPTNTFELIIVNDCSPDFSYKVLKEIKGVILLNNLENEGFISSCNKGAGLAKGKYLYFLNNDVEVLSGWLDNLVETFDNFPGTGLVGSKLLFENGLLQEAGGIIWSDGSAWNFGRMLDPLDPLYNYAREVDYCSGASIMIPKIIFDELGGFDDHFKPAYYEDVDIAFKLRDKGYRVIYQPLSVVIHHEGISSGTDLNKGVKAYQGINQLKFYDRWEKRLVNYQNPGENSDAAKDRRHLHRILVLDNNTLTPNEDAGSLLIFNLCMLLRELSFQVTFIPTAAMLEVDKHTKRLQKVGIEVIYAPYTPNLEFHLKSSGNRYEAVMMVRPDCVIGAIDLVNQYCPDAQKIFHTIDMHHIRMIRESIVKNSDSIMSDALKMKAQEFSAINKSDCIIAVTAEDAAVIRKEMPDKNIFIFGMILNQHKFVKSHQTRNGLVFVGGFGHAPNKDAIAYFVQEVMPTLITFHPDLVLSIVGSNIPEDIYQLESENIQVVGHVDNLDNFLSDRLINIAPLRFGAGIKGKIAHAMSCGLPSVATSLATEGMGLIDSNNVMIANNPHEFIRSIDRLIREPMLWSCLSQNGSKYADSMWGEKFAIMQLKHLLSSVNISATPGPYPIKLYDDRLA